MLVGTIIGIEILKAVSNSFMGKFVPAVLIILILFTIFFKKTGMEEREIKKNKFHKDNHSSGSVCHWCL